MSRDFNTPRQDFPTPENIWDYAQNTEFLYLEGEAANSSEELSEHARHAIACFNEAQDSFKAPTYVGVVQDVIDYFEVMAMDKPCLQLTLSEMLVSGNMTRDEMISKAKEIDIQPVDDDDSIGRLNEGELRNLLLHLSV